MTEQRRAAVRVPPPRAGRSRTGPASPAGATSPASSGSPPSGSGSTASRTSSSCAPCSATSSTSAFYADLEADQQRLATMSMLVPPQMINTMVPRRGARSPTPFYADPVRRYMIPVASDRRTDWPSHPYATRDSLHEHDMWVAEGLTHRYPTKVLAELLSTCPQYCGHCTRMDLVGNSTPAVDKLKLTLKPVDRYDAHIAYLQGPPGRPRRRRLRRRRGQRAVAQPRVVPHAPARHRDHPRHPPRHQGADGPAPALAAARRRRGPGAGRPHRRPPRRQPGHPHPRQPRQVADPAGGPRRADRARGRRARRAQPGRAHARRQRHRGRPARPVLRAAGRGRHPAVLLLHVRHDPQRRALAGRRSGRPSSCSTTSWATCPATPPRASSATCRSSASAGCTWSPSTTASTASRYWTKNYRTSIEADDDDGAGQALPVLRPDRHAARVRPEVVAQAAAGTPDPTPGVRLWTPGDVRVASPVILEDVPRLTAGILHMLASLLALAACSRRLGLHGSLSVRRRCAPWPLPVSSRPCSRPVREAHRDRLGSSPMGEVGPSLADIGAASPTATRRAY